MRHHTSKYRSTSRKEALCALRSFFPRCFCESFERTLVNSIKFGTYSSKKVSFEILPRSRTTAMISPQAIRISTCGELSSPIRFFIDLLKSILILLNVSDKKIQYNNTEFFNSYRKIAPLLMYEQKSTDGIRVANKLHPSIASTCSCTKSSLANEHDLSFLAKICSNWTITFTISP